MAALKTTLLSETAFRKTFIFPMRDVIGEAKNVIDIWPYVRSVTDDELFGHEIYDRFVEHVYRDASGRFDHVLVMTKSNDVYLVVVVDLAHDQIHGHHLLDLNQKYGIDDKKRRHPH